MELKFTKSTIIHPILFAVFPILLIISSNLDEVILTDAVLSFLLIIIAACGSWFLLNLFLKNKFKSGLFVSLGVFFFFSYGYFLRFTTKLGIDVSSLPFSHHTYGVPVYFLLLLVGVFAIFKLKKRLPDVTIFTNVFSIILIVILLPNVISYSLENQNNEPVVNPLNYQLSNTSMLADTPNIYYIILDEYAGDEILEQIYNYDNSSFLYELEQRGFEIPPESFTNYSTSSLALSANLNMHYVNDKIQNPTLDRKNVLYNNNQIMRIFSSLDYTVITMSLEYGYPELANYHLCPPALFVNQFHNTLLDVSFWQPFSKYFVTAGEPQRDRVNCKFHELSNLHNSYDSPFFVFAHIMSPHPPYLFGPNGEPMNPEFLSIGADSWNNKAGYINQLQYINKKVIDTVDKILLENDPHPIIIIQGDHGTPTQLGGGGLRWTSINNDSIRERMSIFNAYYLPGTTELIYDEITPVNSFRLVLNNYFNGDYELLEDKMYFSIYQNMLNFTEVTPLLTSTPISEYSEN